MDSTRLTTRTGEYVSTVQISPFAVPPEIIRWADRFFVRQVSGTYREAEAWTAYSHADLMGD